MPPVKFLLIVGTAFAQDLCMATWTYALAHHLIILCVTTTALCPFLGLLGVAFFVDAKSWIERLLVAAATSIGYTVATSATLALVWIGAL